MFGVCPFAEAMLIFPIPLILGNIRKSPNQESFRSKTQGDKSSRSLLDDTGKEMN